jgi:hypothetical protein
LWFPSGDEPYAKTWLQSKIASQAFPIKEYVAEAANISSKMPNETEIEREFIFELNKLLTTVETDDEE